MRPFPTGTVVTSGREERAEGMTANAVVSVSLDPPLFLVMSTRTPVQPPYPRGGRRRQYPGRRTGGVIQARLPRALERAAGDPVSRRRLRLYRRPARDGGARGHRVRARSTRRGDHDLFVGRVVAVRMGDTCRNLDLPRGRIHHPQTRATSRGGRRVRRLRPRLRRPPAAPQRKKAPLEPGCSTGSYSLSSGRTLQIPRGSCSRRARSRTE